MTDCKIRELVYTFRSAVETMILYPCTSTKTYPSNRVCLYPGIRPQKGYPVKWIALTAGLPLPL